MADTEKSDSPKNELQQQNEGLVRETPKRAAKLEIKSLREENSESSENSTDNETDPEPEPQKRKIFHWTDEASKMLVREVNKRKQALVSPFIMQGRLWNEIADAMRAAEYDLSVMQCKTKWTNLVGTFNRVLNDKSLDLNAKKERFSCFNLINIMHSKVQNFTKKEKSPTPLDQTVDKTLYEVELQNMSADKSMSFSNIKPLSKGIKRQCDGSQKTEQIPTERIAICTQTFKKLPQTPFKRHTEKSQAARFNFHRQQLNAEDPEATVIILEDDQKKDYTIIAQNESEAVEENESFGSFSIVKQKNISSSSDVQVMECNQSPQVISSFSQEDFSNMIEPPSQMNASSFTKSEVENSALMGNLIKRSDVNATNNSRFNIISEYILPPGISIRAISGESLPPLVSKNNCNMADSKQIPMANSKQIPMANSKQIPMTLSQPKPAQSQPPKTPRKKQAPKTPSRKSARTQQTDEVEPPSKQAIIKTYSRSSRESDSQDSRQSVDIPRKQHMIVKVPPQKPTVTIKKNPGSKLMAPQPIQAPSPMPSPIQKNSTMSQVSQLSYQSPHCTQSSLMLLNSAISIKPIAPKQQDSSATPPKWFEEYMRKFVNPKLDLINSKLDVILDKMVGQQRSIADNHHY